MSKHASEPRKAAISTWTNMNVDVGSPGGMDYGMEEGYDEMGDMGDMMDDYDGEEGSHAHVRFTISTITR